MYEAGYHLEFHNGRFPARVLLLAFSITAIALVFSHGADWQISLSVSQCFTLFLYIGIYCLACLLILNAMRSMLASYPMLRSMALAWLVFVLVAVIFAALLTLNRDLEFKFWLFDNRYLTPEVDFALLVFSLILTPILLWFEKKVFADKAAMVAAEMEQYTNLDFRIRPHFLFNSLNSVAGLINQNPDRAENALYNLSDVFRAVMADKRQLVPLKAELDLAEKYLYLEKIRLGERLEISSKIDSSTVGIKVPVFLLQPLLENAVYHGIETRFKGGKISLNIARKNDELVIKITNPLPESGVKRRTGNKVAQQNLRERIKAVFGRRAVLESYEAETSFNVVVRLPL